MVVQSVLSRLGQLLKAQPKHLERDGPMSDHELGRAIREIRLVISGKYLRISASSIGITQPPNAK